MLPSRVQKTEGEKTQPRGFDGYHLRVEARKIWLLIANGGKQGVMTERVSLARRKARTAASRLEHEGPEAALTMGLARVRKVFTPLQSQFPITDLAVTQSSPTLPRRTTACRVPMITHSRRQRLKRRIGGEALDMAVGLARTPMIWRQSMSHWLGRSARASEGECSDKNAVTFGTVRGARTSLFWPKKVRSAMVWRQPPTKSFTLGRDSWSDTH